uniref:GTP cyclohydrolase 1 n=1 Tax=Kalanchoe fedtschenkoi TaxID=63787 RepID=A0A7N0VF57_KALFE
MQCLHLRFPNPEPVIQDCRHGTNIKLIVSSGSGVFNNKKAGVWEDFLSLLRFRGINIEKPCNEDAADQCWCPSKCAQSFFTSDTALEYPKMIAAVASIIRSLGENPSRKELLETPKHFLKWLMTFRSSNLDLNLNGHVYVRMECGQPNGIAFHHETKIQSELNLPVWSQCEHHLLPFYGVVHLGYISDKKVSSKVVSLLQSMVHYHGFKLQVQERLTRQIAETVSSLLGSDVIVVVEANHTCMISRGIEKFGSSTATIALLGRFSTEPALRSKFLETIPKMTIS